MGYNDLRDIAPVLQGHACLYGQSIHAMFPQSFPMYTVVLENRPRSNLPVFKSFGGSKPLRIWQTKKPSGACSPGGMHAYMDRVFMQCFLNPFRCTVVLEKQATKQLARLQELWWKQATEDLANEEAKWVKLKDKKKASYRIRKGN
ncbi:hypothetical protein TNCV_3694811 [Trichonephila clavipes]|nr:hypothetical protein TNCV_3694811 [Trichonephila clavipes]